MFRLLTGLIKNSSYTCLFFSLTMDTASITEARVPPRLETTSDEMTVNEMACPVPVDRKRNRTEINGSPIQRETITFDL